MGGSGGGNKNFPGQGTQPGAPAKQLTPEEIQQLQQQVQLQQQQLDQQRQQQELAKNAMPELTYNPITETTGSDGKKTIGLREELQLRSPEEFITSEKGRMGLAQTQAQDELNKQMMQQQAQQRAAAMSRGGMRGGTGALDRFSMREALMGKQKLAGQGLAQQAEFASKAEQLRSQAREKQVGALGEAIKGVEQFNLDRWKKMKDVEASKAQAEATRQAGGGGGKK